MDYISEIKALAQEHTVYSALTAINGSLVNR